MESEVTHETGEERSKENGETEIGGLAEEVIKTGMRCWCEVGRGRRKWNNVLIKVWTQDVFIVKCIFFAALPPAVYSSLNCGPNLFLKHGL